MNKKKFIITIAIILLLASLATVAGIILTNRNNVRASKDVSDIHTAIDDTNDPDTKYITNAYSDLGQNLIETPGATVSTKDKQSSINLIDDALKNTDSTGVDQNGGFDINLNTL